MNKPLIAGALCSALFSSIAFASPVNLPTAIKGQEGAGLISNSPVGFSAGFLNDYVGERKLNNDVGKASFDMIGGNILVSLLDRFDIYTMLGSALSPEVKGPGYQFNFSDDFMWGAGASALIYDWKNVSVQVFGDGNYRESRGIDFDSVIVNGTTYSKSQLGLTASAKWQEWQVALGVSKKFQYVIPYAGVAYSDVKASGKATVSGTTYDLGSASSRYKVGPFVGISIMPTKWLSIDVTGRFVAEEAVSAAATIKF